MCGGEKTHFTSREKQLTSPQRSHAIAASASSQRLADPTLQLEAARQTLGSVRSGMRRCVHEFVEGVSEVPDKVLSFESDFICKSVSHVNTHISQDLGSPI